MNNMKRIVEHILFKRQNTRRRQSGQAHQHTRQTIMTLYAISLLTIAMLAGPAKSIATSNVSREYRQEPFRICYSVDETGIPQDDSNRNGVPDRVEDIMTQLKSVRDLFLTLGFPDPLGSERFATVNEFVVNLVPRRKLGHNVIGRAHWGASSNGKSIYMEISEDQDAKWSSAPVHEYFHYIQFSAMSYNRAWLLEGTARWAEDVVKDVARQPVDTLAADVQDPYFMRAVTSSSYSSALMLWRPLCAICGTARIPDHLVRKRRYVDGTPVFEGSSIQGAAAIRNVFDCLGRNGMDVKLDKNEEDIDIMNCVRSTVQWCLSKTK